ncbi:MAG: hypothetical protein LBJ88_01690 [Campylobacteraceae bacterium]|jgi:hypothetical protein|nr:hypothetical protein [Campylobacteraceae bacterium]
MIDVVARIIGIFIKKSVSINDLSYLLGKAEQTHGVGRSINIFKKNVLNIPTIALVLFCTAAFIIFGLSITVILNAVSKTTTSASANSNNKIQTPKISALIDDDKVQTPKTNIPTSHDEIRTYQVNTHISNREYICTGGGEVMYGYQLPPCPDLKENDKTLLGIDTNDNGVRDDVEVWIYHHYDKYIPCVEVEVNVTAPDGKIVRGFKDVCEDTVKPYHQIVREITMQYAKAYQIVIQKPEKAKKTIKYMDNALLCELYFLTDAKYLNEPTFRDKNNNIYKYKELEDIQLNTVQRARAFRKYIFYLKGGRYELEDGLKKRRNACDFDVDKLLEK